MLAISAVVALGLWLGLLGFRRGFWRADQVLEPSAAVPGRHPPEVVAVIPARNEAEVIGRSLPTVLNQDYPGRLTVVLVDDNSDDRTAEVARAAAAACGAADRLTVVTGEPLPPGWTGKLWALRCGLKAARATAPGAELVLLTDADIAHGPGVLAALVAQADGRELVSVMARLRCDSGWERLLIPAFVFFFQKLYPFPAVNDPLSPTAAAAGGCVLVRRETLREAGGIAAIRDRIIDDCALAALIKRRGAIWLGFHDEVTSLRAYDTLSEIWNMVARTAFVQLEHRWLLLGGTVLGMALLYLTPPLAGIAGLVQGNSAAAVAGLGAWWVMAKLYRPTLALYDRPRREGFLLPVAGFLYGAMTVDSARRFLMGSGGRWKGRSYAGAGELLDAEAAARHARKVAARSGTSFFWAMALLPKARRRGMFAVYAFCREVDDIADGNANPAAKRAALAEWRAEVARLTEGCPTTPLGRALEEALRLFAIRRTDMEAVIDGMEMDCEPIVAPDLATLDLYCDRVASAVGRLSAHVFGLTPAQGDRLSHALGRALQLTNILRDVAEDAGRGRLYLPREALQRHGIPVGSAAAALAHPDLPKACAEVGAMARDRFREAEEALALCNRRLARPAVLMMVVYRRLLERMEAAGWPVSDPPVSLTKAEKIGLTLRHMLF